MGTALVLAGVCLLVALVSIPAALLLAPGFVLLTIFSLGFFPGEKAIERMRERKRRPNRVARPTDGLMPTRLDFVRQTGLDIAYALAVRPPPYFSVTHR